MITSEYVLELSNVFHSGQVEAGTCLQKMIGTVRTGVILKDVSLEVHGGELSAVLGSKGWLTPCWATQDFLAKAVVVLYLFCPWL